jgi:hypothetical protein
MKRFFLAVLIASFAAGSAMAQSCETQAVSKEGKPLTSRELRARLELAEQRLADLRELVHDLKVDRDDWKTVAKRLALTSSQPQQQPPATPPPAAVIVPAAAPEPVRASAGMAAVHSTGPERRGWWPRWLG